LHYHFELNDKWNLISCTVLPIIDPKGIAPGSGNQSGRGDSVQTLFFSPRPGPGGTVWGACASWNNKVRLVTKSDIWRFQFISSDFGKYRSVLRNITPTSS
jgi:hypothetical protein